MDKVELKRLKIEKYRNVAPGTVLEFNDGFNVLLGQNGTGKTTLLELIAMVTASRFGSLKDTEFSISYTLGFADASIDVVFENARTDTETLLNEFFSWSYRVVMTVASPPRTWTARATMNEMLVYAGEQSEDSVSTPFASPFERNVLSHALTAFMVILHKERDEQRVL
ncbi:MAG: AAA family ATPase, partial [Byssovorax sp.]